jgi:hypothetical protein
MWNHKVMRHELFQSNVLRRKRWNIDGVLAAAAGGGCVMAVRDANLQSTIVCHVCLSFTFTKSHSL